MSSIYRRPIIQRKRNIGSWGWILHFLSIVAVFTNSLLFLNGYDNFFMTLVTKAGKKPFPYWKLFQFIIIEHVALVVIVLLRVIIKNSPYWVRLFLQRRDYRLKVNSLDQE